MRNTSTAASAPGVPIIGYIHGRPVFRIAGGDGTGDNGGQGSGQGSGQGDAGGDSNSGSGSGQSEGQQGGQASGQGSQAGAADQRGQSSGSGQSQGQSGGQGAQDGDLSSLPEWAQKQIRDLRGEAANHRTKARDAEGKAKGADEKYQKTLDGIAKALGLKQDDGPPDPAKLTEQLTQSQTQAQQAQEAAVAAQIELQVFRTATTLGANATKLLDSRSFCDRVDALEPKDEADFAKLLEAEIKTALDKDPSLRADGQKPADRSGGQMPGAPGTGRKRPAGLHDAIAKSYQRT